MRWISILASTASSTVGQVRAKRLFTRVSQIEAMRELILTTAMIAGVALPAKAAEQSWGNGVPWNQAFPEREQFGAFSPRWAASWVGAHVKSPEWLIQFWNRLPNDLHQWDCGTDSLGHTKRCLDAVFQARVNTLERLSQRISILLPAPGTLPASTSAEGFPYAAARARAMKCSSRGGIPPTHPAFRHDSSSADQARRPASSIGSASGFASGIAVGLGWASTRSRFLANRRGTGERRLSLVKRCDQVVDYGSR
jgi:hypothetical protein